MSHQSTQKSYWVCTEWTTSYFYAMQYFAVDIEDLTRQLDAEANAITTQMVKRNPHYVLADVEWEFIMNDIEPDSYEEFRVDTVHHHTTKRGRGGGAQK